MSRDERWGDIICVFIFGFLLGIGLSLFLSDYYWRLWAINNDFAHYDTKNGNISWKINKKK